MALPWIIGAAAVAFGIKKIVDIRKEKNSPAGILAASKVHYEEALSQLASGKRELESALGALGEQTQTIVAEMADFQNLAKTLVEKILANSTNKEADAALFQLSIPEEKLTQIAQFIERKVDAALPNLDIPIVEPAIAAAQWAFDAKAEKAAEMFEDIQKELAATFETIQNNINHQRKGRQYVEKIQQALSLIEHVFQGYVKDLQSVAEYLNAPPNINDDASSPAPAPSMDVPGVAQMLKNGYALSAILAAVASTGIFKTQADNPQELERDEKGLYQFNMDAIENAIAQGVKDLPNYLK